MNAKTRNGALGAAWKKAAMLVVCLLAACALALPATGAYAADGAGLAAGSMAVGTQGNNKFSTATAISPNGSVTAKLNEYGTGNMGVYVYEDWYKFSLPKAGFVQVTLSANYVDRYFAADPWCMELRSSSNTWMWSGTRPNRSGAYTMFLMGLPAGTYYLNLYTASVPNVSYTLSTYYAASSDWESEPANDYMYSAGSLTLGKTKFGSVYGNLDMGSNTDRDWYKFSASKAGNYSVRFGADYSSRRPNGWYLVRVYDAWGNWVWDTTCKADGYVRTVGTLSLSAGTYYVRVNGDNYMDAQHYELTVNSAAKMANTLSASGKTVSFKYSQVKKGARSVAAGTAFKVSNAKGAVSYAKQSGNAKITVSKAGKLTVKKGLKKGTYKVKIKVSAAGNASYNAGSKTVTVTVKVK